MKRLCGLEEGYRRTRQTVKLLGKGDMALDLAEGSTLSLTQTISLRLQPSLVCAEGHDTTLRLGSGTALEFNGKIGSWHKNKVDQIQRANDQVQSTEKNVPRNLKGC